MPNNQDKEIKCCGCEARIEKGKSDVILNAFCTCPCHKVVDSKKCDHGTFPCFSSGMCKVSPLNQAPEEEDTCRNCTKKIEQGRNFCNPNCQNMFMGYAPESKRCKHDVDGTDCFTCYPAPESKEWKEELRLNFAIWQTGKKDYNDRLFSFIANQISKARSEAQRDERERIEIEIEKMKCDPGDIVTGYVVPLGDIIKSLTYSTNE